MYPHTIIEPTNAGLDLDDEMQKESRDDCGKGGRTICKRNHSDTINVGVNLDGEMQKEKIDECGLTIDYEGGRKFFK